MPQFFKPKMLLSSLSAAENVIVIESYSFVKVSISFFFFFSFFPQ